MINVDDEISLAYLLDPVFQLVNTAGKPLTDGWLEVYIHGTRNKYYCYKDWGKEFLHPFKIPLDSLGSNIVLASPAHAYDIYVYNNFGSLIMSRYNVVPVTGEGTVIKGIVNINSEDNSVKVTESTDVQTDTKKFDLSVNTDIIATKDSVDKVKTDLNNLTVTVDNHTNQIGQIQQVLSNNSWTDLSCVPYDSTIKLAIINAGYRNGFLNFNGTVEKINSTFTKNAANYLFSVEGIALKLDFRNYYGTCAYNSNTNLFPCAMAALKNTNTFYIYPTENCNIFYFNGTVPVDILT